MYPISFVLLRVSHSINVYLTSCLSNSVCIAFRVYLIPCPIPCASHFVYPTLYMSYSVKIQFRESPTSITHSICIPPCVSHPMCLTPYVSHSVCVPLRVLYYTPLRLDPTLCVSRSECPSPCESHFVCVPFLCIPISHSVCPLSNSVCPTPCSTPCVSHFVYASLSHFVCVSLRMRPTSCGLPVCILHSLCVLPIKGSTPYVFYSLVCPLLWVPYQGCGPRIVKASQVAHQCTASKV